MARKKKDARLDAPGDLNLVPIMNLVVCLIPMVLAGAAMVKVGVVNVSAPMFGPNIVAPEPAPLIEPLDLSVAVSADGFRLKARADLTAILGTPDAHIALVGDAYDYAGLYNTLAAVKADYPGETILRLTADARVPFKHIVAVMDVARFKLDGQGFADLSALQAASVALAEGQPERLWSDVVFSVAM